jgi:hypothetical protein
MGAPENKALVRRLFEQGMNERKAEIFNECVAPNFVNREPAGAHPRTRRVPPELRQEECSFVVEADATEGAPHVGKFGREAQRPRAGRPDGDGWSGMLHGPGRPPPR